MNNIVSGHSQVSCWPLYALRPLYDHYTATIRPRLMTIFEVSFSSLSVTSRELQKPYSGHILWPYSGCIVLLTVSDWDRMMTLWSETGAWGMFCTMEHSIFCLSLNLPQIIIYFWLPWLCHYIWPQFL